MVESENNSAEGGRNLGLSAGAIGGLIAVVLLVIIVLQNTDTHEINLLFWSPKTSTSWLVFIIIALTLVGERLIGFVLRRRKNKD